MAQDADFSDDDVNELIDDPTILDKPKKKPRKKYTYQSEETKAAKSRAVAGADERTVIKGILAQDMKWLKYAPVKAKFFTSFPTVEKLTDHIQQYLKSYDGSSDNKIPTLTGLALWLGFNDRMHMCNVVLKPGSWLPPGYGDVMRKAAAYFENLHEANLSKAGNHGGSIFWLKNRGWTDIPARQEAKGNTINIIISNKDTDKGLKEALSSITEEAQVIETDTTDGELDEEESNGQL